jgi:photosystem II stability/assembly factor-like uncharacterized protein
MALRLTRTLTALAILVVAPSGGAAQSAAPDSAIFAAFRWRNIGPANPGGRVVDIEAVENDFRTVFVASASGGVFKSVNAGTTWEPIFDRYASASIGDVAIFQPDPNVVWVGTGEANNRNSVAWGDGIYKSTDGGRTFTNMGLRTTHQIARVVTHPTNQNVVYVAAIGHLWGYSGDRGLFKTADGGATWTKLAGGLPSDGRTGATDLIIDPTNPEVLYVAFYHRIRRPWTFHSGGPNGGIFKSTNGGQTWTKLTTGLPTGETGRIGLALFRRNPQIVMAFVEAERSEELSKPGSGIYRSENGGESWTYVNTFNNRPFYYSQIRLDPHDSQRVYILTTNFMVSGDGGKTLVRGDPEDEISNDFHAMWLDPTAPNRYYIGSDKGPSISHDGRRFTFFDNLAISQYYRIGVDMRDPYYVYGGLQDNGTFGGPSFTRDNRGILNDDNWKLHWGDGMYIQIDPTDWRKIYTEAEGGSFRRYDAETHESESSRPSPTNIVNYADVLGADASGMEMFRFNWTTPLVMSPHDPKTLFLAGNRVFRTDDRGHSWRIISPDLSTSDPVRTNPESGGITRDVTGAETNATVSSLSQSPIVPGVIWAGTDDGNVQVTRDGGGRWTNVRSTIRGVPQGTWVSRVEASHHDPAVAYVAFDGHRSDVFTAWIFKTDDYGRSWTRITTGIPDDQPVQVIREDPRNPNLLFAGTEFAVYASLDGGRRWTRFTNGMPTVSTHDLVIHPRDMDLVAGTHGRGIWIADDITPLQQLTAEILAAPAHLFVQRPATLWENVGRGGQRGHFWFGGENPPSVQPSGNLPRGSIVNSALITYYLKQAPSAEPTLEISDLSGQNRYTVMLPGRPGIHRYRWSLRFPAPEGPAAGVGRGGRGGGRGAGGAGDAPVTGRGGRGGGSGGGGIAAGPGTYRLTLTVDGKQYRSSITVRADPLLGPR